MIEVKRLTKSYDDTQRGKLIAVDAISFSAGSGEIFGLLGPNGAGKTTVLRILSTVLKPTGGSARIMGYDVVEQAAEVRQRIGFVSNNTAIYDRMTAWELVEYFGRLHGMSGDSLRERMEAVFACLHMNSFRDAPCGKLSTGMKQKVSIGRAIVHDPPVLVFDEATLGLDVLVARSLLEIIRQLRDVGKCIIFSTHIMREVERLCDKIAIMNHGRILDIGSLSQLKGRHPGDDFEDLFHGLLLRSEEGRERADASVQVSALGCIAPLGWASANGERR